MWKAIVLGLSFILAVADDCNACTSAIVSGSVTSNGNMLLWKHRDTSYADNYIDTVSAGPGGFRYVALFNASDSLKREAWAGVNSAGFGIINTVAGNLPANSPDCIDREGFIMSEALSHCVTVDDFARLLDSLPKPLGARANFGVADAKGNGAYFETRDDGYKVFSLSDAPKGFLVRSNFAEGWNQAGGYGYDRYRNAARVLEKASSSHEISSNLFTEFLSRKFYSAETGRCVSPENCSSKTIPDSGYIPRPSSASSVVIELTPEEPVMWVMLGYPPAAVTHPVTLDSVDESLRRNPSTGRSDECDASLKLKRKMLVKGKIRLADACRIAAEAEEASLENYRRFHRDLNKE